MEIIPGILEQEWDAIEKKLEIIKPFAKTIHIDLLDGKFAPNTTFMDPAPFKKYTGDLFFELHMMVEEPSQYLQSFADAGFKRFIGHIEQMSDQAEFIAKAQFLGEAGLYIDGPTDLAELVVPFEDLDCIGIFTAAKAGYSGQPFEEAMLEKVKTIRQQSEWIAIEIDGGTNDETIVKSKEAGATRFIATSFLFGKGESPEAQYNCLKQLVTDSV
jgi:ribulose-phosphate 3-epimerase